MNRSTLDVPARGPSLAYENNETTTTRSARRRCRPARGRGRGRVGVSALATLAVATSVPLGAQELIGVSWPHNVYSIDPYTASATLIGRGVEGQNALAVTGQCTLWTNDRVSTGSGWQYGLATVDPNSGAGAGVHSDVADVRGLTGDGSHILWGVENVTTGDRLVRIDTISGSVTPIGSGLGFRAVQSIEMHDGTLYAYDVGAGLLVVDPVSGVATDVDPSVPGIPIQFLAVRSDGALIGGQRDLYTIDPATGVATLIGRMGSADIRGATSRAGRLSSFGAGCAAQFGPSTLTITGTPAAGATITMTSSNHAPNAPGVLVAGVSRTAHLGVPLPLPLDPFLGTSGCSLYTSIELTLTGTTTASTPAQLSFALPLPNGLQCPPLYFQHAVLEPVQGGVSWSNGGGVGLPF